MCLFYLFNTFSTNDKIIKPYLYGLFWGREMVHQSSQDPLSFVGSAQVSWAILTQESEDGFHTCLYRCARSLSSASLAGREVSQPIGSMPARVSPRESRSLFAHWSVRSSLPGPSRFWDSSSTPPILLHSLSLPFPSQISLWPNRNGKLKHTHICGSCCLASKVAVFHHWSVPKGHFNFSYILTRQKKRKTYLLCFLLLLEQVAILLQLTTILQSNLSW